MSWGSWVLCCMYNIQVYILDINQLQQEQIFFSCVQNFKMSSPEFHHNGLKCVGVILQGICTWLPCDILDVASLGHTIILQSKLPNHIIGMVNHFCFLTIFESSVSHPIEWVVPGHVNWFYHMPMTSFI